MYPACNCRRCCGRPPWNIITKFGVRKLHLVENIVVRVMISLAVLTEFRRDTNRQTDGQIQGYRPTQPPTLSGTGNEYQPKCGDALQLRSKGRYGSFHLWINVWVAGKTV